MDHNEIDDAIRALSGQNLGRLIILIDSTKTTGLTQDVLYSKVADWIDKLQSNQWIPGTPWNIPDDQKWNIVKHLDGVLAKAGVGQRWSI